MLKELEVESWYLDSIGVALAKNDYLGQSLLTTSVLTRTNDLSIFLRILSKRLEFSR